LPLFALPSHAQITCLLFVPLQATPYASAFLDKTPSCGTKQRITTKERVSVRPFCQGHRSKKAAELLLLAK
jgi:hypothetical protein